MFANALLVYRRIEGNNGLRTLSEGTFEQLSASTVTLTENKGLSEIGDGAFKGLKSLR